MLESRMALDERLRSKFGLVPAQTVVHPLLDSVGPTKDPYAFHDEGVKELKVPPKEIQKERKSGRSKTIAQLTGVAKPSQWKSNAKTSKSVTVSNIAKLYPALADKLGQQPQPKQVLKPPPTRPEGEKPAETVNKLENKIAQSRIRDKQKKAQGAAAQGAAAKQQGASLSTATATIPAVQGVFPSVPAAIITPPLRLPVSSPLPAGAPVVAPPMISHPQLPSSFAYAHLGAYPPHIAIDPSLAFQPGLIPVPATAQPAPLKESKPVKASKHTQGVKSSKSSLKSEGRNVVSKPEPVQPFREIMPPSSPVTITQMRIRPRQEARHKTKHIDERLTSAYARKVHQCLCRKRKRFPSLLPSGIYSSDDSDSDDDIQVPWQREWFRPPVLPNCCIQDRDGEHCLSRSQSLVLTRASLRHELLQLHHAQQHHLNDQSLLPEADLLLFAAAAKDPTATANVLSVLRESKSWYSQRKKLKSKRKRRKCLHRNSDEKPCVGTALPFTNHCLSHITYNVDQQLFDYCTAKFSDNTQCCVPVFDIRHELPLCAEHAAKADNYNRLLLEGKPKKPRKKTKPSAMTRPPKKGKKKKNQRRNNKAQRMTSPIPSPEDTETDDPMTSKEEFPSAPPPLKELKDLSQSALSTQSESEDLGEDLEPSLSPGAIDKTLDVLDTEGDAKFLDEHDLNEVFNKLPDETFDLFTSNFGKNGDLMPTKEEADALERALAEASKDVTDAAETLLQMGSEPHTSLPSASSTHSTLPQMGTVRISHNSSTVPLHMNTSSSLPVPVEYIKEEKEDELPEGLADEILDHELSQHSLSASQHSLVGSQHSLNESQQRLNSSQGSLNNSQHSLQGSQTSVTPDGSANCSPQNFALITSSSHSSLSSSQQSLGVFDNSQQRLNVNQRSLQLPQQALNSDQDIVNQRNIDCNSTQAEIPSLHFGRSYIPVSVSVGDIKTSVQHLHTSQQASGQSLPSIGEITKGHFVLPVGLNAQSLSQCLPPNVVVTSHVSKVAAHVSQVPSVTVTAALNSSLSSECVSQGSLPSHVIQSITRQVLASHASDIALQPQVPQGLGQAHSKSGQGPIAQSYEQAAVSGHIRSNIQQGSPKPPEFIRHGTSPVQTFQGHQAGAMPSNSHVQTSLPSVSNVLNRIPISLHSTVGVRGSQGDNTAKSPASLQATLPSVSHITSTVQAPIVATQSSLPVVSYGCVSQPVDVVMPVTQTESSRLLQAHHMHRQTIPTQTTAAAPIPAATKEQERTISNQPLTAQLNLPASKKGDSSVASAPQKAEGMPQPQANQIHLPVLQRQLAAGPMHPGPLQLQISGQISPLQGAVITLTPQGPIATPLSHSQLALAQSLSAAEHQQVSMGASGAGSQQAVFSSPQLSKMGAEQGEAALSPDTRPATQTQVPTSQQKLQGTSSAHTVSTESGKGEGHTTTGGLQFQSQHVQAPFIASQTLQQLQAQQGGHVLQNILTPQLLAALQQQQAAVLQNGLPPGGSKAQPSQPGTPVSSAKVTVPLPHFVLPPQGSMLGQGSALLVQPGQSMFQLPVPTPPAQSQAPATTAPSTS